MKRQIEVCLNVYGAILALQAKTLRLEIQLSEMMKSLSPKEMAELLERLDKLDTKHGDLTNGC